MNCILEELRGLEKQEYFILRERHRVGQVLHPYDTYLTCIRGLDSKLIFYVASLKIRFRHS